MIASFNSFILASEKSCFPVCKVAKWKGQNTTVQKLPKYQNRQMTSIFIAGTKGPRTIVTPDTWQFYSYWG